MRTTIPALSALLVAATAAAQSPEPLGTAPVLYEEVLVTGGREAIRTLPGSATFVGEEAIERFDVADINDLLAEVPGVYIRFEDGYGLRPNIGIRGATAERSQKITLMEDGVLIAPAPYSAPAAYYFPNVSRMSAVEVFKGPAAIKYGPHTVGGALNLITPPVPQERVGELSLAYGTDNYHKGRLFYGNTFPLAAKSGGNADQVGFWVDALRFGADGFKELDGGGDTGFERNDLNAKLQWQSASDAAIDQRLEFKLGYADEHSRETYLGLTDADFAANPVRRYRASELDEFESEHSQLHVLHTADFGNGWSTVARAYVNRFDREWNKFDGFLPASLPAEDPYQGHLSASTVLNNADVFTTRMALLRGDLNSDGSLEQTLDITNNAREYGSQGVEFSSRYAWQLSRVVHNLEVGLRYHHDYVERDHQVRGYWMQNGELVFDGVTDRPKKAFNKAETDAIAAYISDEIVVGDLKVHLGVRTENIEGELRDYLADTTNEHTQQVVIPGLGVFYQLTDNLGILAGVNKGFSPNGPGAADDVEPEESTNYEYGVRYYRAGVSLDAIGFFSDYSNLLGRCRVSDAGCEVGEEFNGGNVEIAGLEFTGSYEIALKGGLTVPVSVVYTYTESAFQTSFSSGFSQWGLVRPGDELPYMPEHQGRFLTGLQAEGWSLDLAVNYVGAMREEPGQGALATDKSTQALTTVDIAGTYIPLDAVELQLVATNVFDEKEIVSRRPFGARPNQPRSVQLGATYRF